MFDNPFLNLGYVAFQMFCLNFMESIPTTALGFILDPINSFKTLNYCREAYLVYRKMFYILIFEGCAHVKPR